MGSTVSEEHRVGFRVEVESRAGKQCPKVIHVDWEGKAKLECSQAMHRSLLIS